MSGDCRAASQNVGIHAQPAGLEEPTGPREEEALAVDLVTCGWRGTSSSESSRAAK